jgi:hypothetical protein
LAGLHENAGRAAIEQISPDQSYLKNPLAHAARSTARAGERETAAIATVLSASPARKETGPEEVFWSLAA